MKISVDVLCAESGRTEDAAKNAEEAVIFHLQLLTDSRLSATATLGRNEVIIPGIPGSLIQRHLNGPGGTIHEK